MDKISLIIPVYKVEKYLDECVKSALAQNWTNLEILLVDDGSPDRCPAICDYYAAEYENVRVIHQKNQGVAAARNAGLAAAEGKWVAFADGDDALDGPDALRLLAQRAGETRADITVGSFRRLRETANEPDSQEKNWEISETNHHHLKEGSYTSTVDFRFKGFYMYGHLAYNWGKLYRRDFLLKNGLWSPVFPFTQDKAHNIECCACEPVYSFVDESVYLYRENEESVSGRYKKNLMPVWISIAEDFQTFLKERQITKDYGDLIAFHLFFGAFFLVKQELSHVRKERENSRGQNGILAAAGVLREYGQNPLVRKAFAQLARGRYLKEIDSLSWKLVLWGGSVLFGLHGYLPMAAGIALMRSLGMDTKITRRRYRKKRKASEKKMKTRGQSLTLEELRLLELLQKAIRKTDSDTENSNEHEKEEGRKTDPESTEEAVIEIAQKHAVLPLLYGVMEGFCGGSAVEKQDFRGGAAVHPENAVKSQNQKIVTAARRTVLQSYRLLFVTKYIVHFLEERQIPVAVIKGVSAAADYPVPELRKSGDVDLLFLGSDRTGSGHIPTRPEMDRIMEEAGFRVADEQHANHHVEYSNSDGIHVELHMQAAESFAYPAINAGMEHWMEKRAEHCIRREIMGVSLPVLDRPYQAYQLLLHMLQHFVYAGFGLKLLCDWTVLFREEWTEEEKELLGRMTEESGLTRFAELVTGACVNYLGLERERVSFWYPTVDTLHQSEEAELFLREAFDSEEFGESEQTRMVMMKGHHLADYLWEFHHQMRLNYPEKGKYPLLWPGLWVLTLLRFVRNNRSLRHVSTISVLKKAGERSRRMERLRIFGK
ncbi:MAG: glycosyltransferase [Lachnospiraceae bacterium]|nr:glycosyltransferase [Lachnospiraceae bacterium]